MGTDSLVKLITYRSGNNLIINVQTREACKNENNLFADMLLDTSADLLCRTLPVSFSPGTVPHHNVFYLINLLKQCFSWSWR